MYLLYQIAFEPFFFFPYQVIKELDKSVFRSKNPQLRRQFHHRVTFTVQLHDRKPFRILRGPSLPIHPRSVIISTHSCSKLIEQSTFLTIKGHYTDCSRRVGNQKRVPKFYGLCPNIEKAITMFFVLPLYIMFLVCYTKLFYICAFKLSLRLKILGINKTPE